jgi:hypothetical protein
MQGEVESIIHPDFKNKANLGKSKIGLRPVIARDYGNICNWIPNENKPKTNPI